MATFDSNDNNPLPTKVRDGILKLRVGERVRVRALDDVLATLDANGRLDSLPFMPEMGQCCGREFTVFKRVDKVNDLVDRTGLRRMTNAVILQGARCDGSHHGGCRALCQTIWKEAWLNRVEERTSNRREDGAASRRDRPHDRNPTLEDIRLAARQPQRDGDERFACQITEIKEASEYLAWWDPRQYVRDLCSGNVTLREMINSLVFWLYTLLIGYAPGHRVLIALYDGFQRLRGGQRYPYRAGHLQKTPVCRLNLQPAERVTVKSHDEILETLDAQNKNRGLSFDVEMVRYCGGVYEVLCRVDKIIEPKSGRMLRFVNDAIILEGVTTRGDYHRFYPQNEYPFWREIWLRRLPAAAAEAGRDPVPSLDERQSSSLPEQRMPG